MDKERRLEELAGRLRERGYRMTPQRMAVLRALLESARHPSVEEMYRAIRPAYPMISRATVYKTIATLKELGEVLELEVSDGHHRYDGYRAEPHPHLFCRRCGRIEDCLLEGMGALTAEAAARPG
ncbi:MAG: transcriptional repressor, partial [Chloroflexi bacterium]|nr:transcriptional repressor [Chloroflexota bacterium]